MLLIIVMDMLLIMILNLLDDGEPSRTAGAPILNQMTGNNLNYTLIIVVRYFGGVKLGVGPLTRAYGKKLLEKLLEIIILLLWLRGMIL